MTSSIKNVLPLGFPWKTQDPFLFCVFHNDQFPKGNEQMGPAESLEGRNIGQDFTVKNGWRMYHGDVVPGFPQHPHRGFETITIVPQGLVDHTDSLGGTGRFGNGDVQWMTAGKGVNHSEMFPLVDQENPNPLLLFQIWLNLPANKKMVEPYYKMLWDKDITTYKSNDGNTSIKLIAGRIEDKSAPDPTPDSWAADPKNEVGVWWISMEPNSSWEIPTASEGTNRSLYFYEGDSVTVDQDKIDQHSCLELFAEQKATIKTGTTACKFLMLQGKPINEPVVQYGPFVMNSEDEIRQAMRDYQQTQFGGWNWPTNDPVHDRNVGRFARHGDGRQEIPD